MIRFKESGLTFLFDDTNCYRIEKDPLVVNGKSSSTSNNMACECISVISGIPDISIKVVSPVDAKQILNIPIE